jgi:hypothetical protein
MSVNPSAIITSWFNKERKSIILSAALATGIGYGAIILSGLALNPLAAGAVGGVAILISYLANSFFAAVLGHCPTHEARSLIFVGLTQTLSVIAVSKVVIAAGIAFSNPAVGIITLTNLLTLFMCVQSSH